MLLEQATWAVEQGITASGLSPELPDPGTGKGKGFLLTERWIDPVSERKAFPSAFNGNPCRELLPKRKADASTAKKVK
jgi:hypothetical protein